MMDKEAHSTCRLDRNMCRLASTTIRRQTLQSEDTISVKTKNAECIEVKGRQATTNISFTEGMN